MTLKRTGCLIHALIKANKDASEVIHNLDDAGVNAICECLYNVCYSEHLNLPSCKKNKLRRKIFPREKDLKKICSKSISPTLRKKLLKKMPDLSEILKLAWPSLVKLTQYDK